MKRDVDPPKHVQAQPLKDLSKLCTADGKDYQNLDVLNDWPYSIPSELDASQMEALQCILTKRLAIIQGPPGE